VVVLVVLQLTRGGAGGWGAAGVASAAPGAASHPASACEGCEGWGWGGGRSDTPFPTQPSGLRLVSNLVTVTSAPVVPQYPTHTHTRTPTRTPGSPAAAGDSAAAPLCLPSTSARMQLILLLRASRSCASTWRAARVTRQEGREVCEEESSKGRLKSVAPSGANRTPFWRRCARPLQGPPAAAAPTQPPPNGLPAHAHAPAQHGPRPPPRARTQSSAAAPKPPPARPRAAPGPAGAPGAGPPGQEWVVVRMCVCVCVCVCVRACVWE